MINKKISEEELMELIRIIEKPVLQYMLKRIQNKIILDKKNKSLTVNSFLSVIIGALSIINANTLKWLSDCTLERTSERIDLNKLRLALLENINNQIGMK